MEAGDAGKQWDGGEDMARRSGETERERERGRSGVKRERGPFTHPCGSGLAASFVIIRASASFSLNKHDDL